MAKAIRGLSLMALGATLSACTQLASPNGTSISSGASGKALAAAPALIGTKRSALTDGCALLDQPLARQRMSGAFEMRLLQRCGRLPPTFRGKARGRPLERAGHLPAGIAEQNGNADVQINDPSLDSGGSTQSETSVAAHGSAVCVAWNDAGEGFGVNGFSGFGFSLDEGKSFHDGGSFPSGPGDTNFGDPSLAYSERDGAFYYAALSSLGLSLWRSSDDCQSFSYVGPIHQGFGDDKELSAVDNSPASPHFGRIYVGWTDFAQGFDGNVASFSDDSGASWSVPSNLPGSGSDGQGMWPAIAPNGDAYFALVNQSFQIGGLQDQWIYKSVDLGAEVEWQKQADIASRQLQPEDEQASSNCGRQALKGDIRNLSSPQIAIHADASAPAGYVINAVYPYDSDGSGPDHSNVFYRRSVDGAESWSPEVRLNDDATLTDQFYPTLAVDANSALAASWYDRRLDPANNLSFDRFVTSSTDGGLSWTPNERLSDVSSPVAQTNPNFDGLAQCYHGDYDQMAVQNGLAHVIWADDRRSTESGPNPDIYYDQIALNPALGRLTAAPNPVSCQGDLQLRLSDADLVGARTQAVSAFTSAGDIETVILAEDAVRPERFVGHIQTAAGEATPGDGVLEVIPSDGIVIAYLDQDTGDGKSVISTLDVAVDCVAPEITALSTEVRGTSATVSVATSEISTLRVDYGFSCESRLSSASGQGGAVALSGLALGQTYFFSVTATDRAGNATSDDAAGDCYRFSTPSQLFLEDFQTGLGAFSVDNSAGAGHGLWHPSESCASLVLGHSQPGSLYYGRDDSCTYDTGAANEGLARSPVVSLESSAGAGIEFNYFLGTEGGGFFDQASLAVSINGGPFQIVDSNFSNLLISDEQAEEHGIRVRDGAISAGGDALVDASGHWQAGFVDLAPSLEGLTSATVQLEFRFATLESFGNGFAGFYIDDVRVLGSAARTACQGDAECDDGLFCDGLEACVDGFCAPGTPVLCAPDADAVDCTVAHCDETARGCVSAPDDARCDDGSFCNGFERCNALAGCVPGSPVQCNDGIACTADRCREDLKSCGAIPQDDVCQDDVFCNGFEICDLTRGCIAGRSPCDDGLACTQDVCTEETFSCENTPQDALCDDGLFCDGTESCDPFRGCLAGEAPCRGQSCNEAQNQCASTCFTSSNGEHTRGGRAQFLLDTVYLALGSNDFLGVDAGTVSSLQGSGNFWQRVDSCPAAPVIDSISVKVVGDVAIVSGTASDANDDLERVIVTFNVFGIPFEVPTEGKGEFSVSISGFFPGQYLVTAQAFDRAGFESDPSSAVTFEIGNPAAPSIDSIAATPSNGETIISGTASDPNGDIEKVVVTVLQGGQIITSGESGAFDPYSVRFSGLRVGSYSARAQAFDASGLASTLSEEVPFEVTAASNVQCIVATNSEHQAAGRAEALFGDTFFFALGSNDFLGVGGGSVTALRGAGSSWEQVESCDTAPAAASVGDAVGGLFRRPVPIE